MKTNKIISTSLILLAFISGCANKEASQNNVAPTVTGIKDIQCIVNTKVDFLAGVAALDKEDGDITPNLEITVTPEVEVKDGVAIFNKVGEYKVNYKITDSQGRTVQKNSFVDVVNREKYTAFDMPQSFEKEANGKAIFERCGMINGEFVVEASGHEVAEDVIVKQHFNLNTNLEYTFNYDVDSNSTGKVKVLADDIECAEIMLEKGSNTLSFKHTIVNPDENKQDVTISLCLGNVNDEKNKVNLVIKNSTINYPQQAGEVVDRSEGFTFKDRVVPRIDGAEGVKGNAWEEDNGKTAVLEIEQASSEVWPGGMFINTDIEFKVGVTYTVSFDIEREFEKYYEIVFLPGQWEEARKYITLYNPDDGHIEQNITVTEGTKGFLWLYVQSGNQTNHIRMRNLKVEEHLNAVGYDDFPIEDYTETHNDAYHPTLTSSLGGFTYTIDKFAPVDGEERVTSPTFYVSGSGANYVLSFKAKANKPIEVVVATPVSRGWDPTLSWGRIYLSDEETAYTFFCNGNGSNRDYTIAWLFGSTNNQQYENVKIEVSDVVISMRNNELDGK